MLTDESRLADADVCRLSATEMAEHVRSGNISSAALVDAHIARIEQVNTALNAVVVKRYEEARREAREADRRRAAGERLGPLHGVPVTVKESLDLTGTPSTFGLPSRATHAAQADEPHVARLRAAGAIVLGKTNVAQLLMFVESHNPVYGRAANPWDLKRTPGGSSGGEAAIIAAGGSPLGLGTDIGGSVRFPAAFCGIASMKPTAGRLPDLGRYSMPVGQTAIASQVGVMARRVDDVALGLGIVNEGVQPIDDAPRPLGDYRSVGLAGLRVAVYTDDGLFPVSPANARAVREAAAMLADAGATVSEWTPPGMDEAYALLTGIFSADGGAAFRGLLGRDKRDPRIAMLVALAGRSRRMLGVLESALRAAGQTSLANGLRAFGHADTSHYWKLTERLLDYRLRFRAAMEAGPDGPIDLILGPAGALPAWTHGASRDLVLGGAYIPLYNVLGYPAGIVPVTTVQAGEESRREPGSDMVQRLAAKVEEGSTGLPIGVQIAARPWREHVALAAMREIERQASQRAGYPRTPHLPV